MKDGTRYYGILTDRGIRFVPVGGPFCACGRKMGLNAACCWRCVMFGGMRK